MSLMFSRSYYGVELMIVGVNGHGITFRGAFNGTMRDCRKYIESEVQRKGYGYRIVKHKTVMEQDGIVASDHLRSLFRTQALSDVHDYLATLLAEVEE